MTLGGRTPARTVEPPDAAGIAEVLRRCDEAGEAVVAVGGGTLQGVGNPPQRYDVALSTRKLNTIATYDPRDLTIGAGAGITVGALARTLAAEGQFLPLDVPQPDRATVGGALAAGWLGPRRALFGKPRDLVIGATAALVDGTLATAGGMVVKNVTGYDLGKLFVGSLGTLGVLTRVNFKLQPLPAAFRVALAPVGEEHRERMLAHVGALPVEPAALLLVHGDAGGIATDSGADTLFVLLQGSEALVERATRELRSSLGAAGIADTVLFDGAEAHGLFAQALAGYVEGVDGGAVTLRALGLPSEAAERAAAVRDLALATIADVRTGDVIVRLPSGRAEPIAEVRRRIGVATVLAGTAHEDAWGTLPAGIATMRTLKAHFDPRNTLAPGRYVGGI